MRLFMASGLVIALVTASAAGCSLVSDSDSSWGYGPYESGTSSGETSRATTSDPRALQPDFGATVSLEKAPPPLSGGTLLVSRDHKRAVAADPDRDQVFIVDLGAAKVEHAVTLEPEDEPGRVVEDAEGRFHVALRRGGSVATITIKEGAAKLERRTVCPAPRGIALDPKGALLVACEGGELVSLPAGEGPARLIARYERDLRDIIVTKNRVFVSTFRSARVLELSHEGALITSSRIPSPGDSMAAAEPMIAFRMIAAAAEDDDSDPVIVHEASRSGALSTGTGGYYGAPPEADSRPCSPSAVVHSAITRGGVHGGTMFLPGAAVLPVDIAVDGTSFAVVAAGNGHTRSLPQLYIMSASRDDWASPCGADVSPYRTPADVQLTAVAFRGGGGAIVQSRQPARLVLLPEGTSISLSGASREDTGHAIFHSNAGVGAACASCHPEGGDDGHTWEFAVIGQRRTPSLRGTLAGTAPFHWDGDIADIGELADDVLSGRMSGPQLDLPQKASLERWLFAIPAPKPSVAADEATVARGKAVFERTDVGCATCHQGSRLTSGRMADVGTGGSFQIPSLVGVASRAPLMHDGCASTLRERFSLACGGAKHGKISQLDAAQIDDLIAYLESL
ncbi:MAG TPA: c-type cytochrome [Labilithrix sp.]|nr:c-type cytochrome [Labilithrix sp.]